MKKVAIIHFLPIELYPPVQNLLNEISTRNLSANTSVFTTHLSNGNLGRFQFSSSVSGIEIVRLGKISQTQGFITRLFNYFVFYGMVLLKLIILQPKSILYFETLSSFPAIFFKFFFKPSVRLFIHYHEYTTPNEYDKGMMLSKYFHSLEKKIYHKSYWVSHTNSHRMMLFQKDIFPTVVNRSEIIPNYPPKRWYSEPKVFAEGPIRVVYAGALSLSTMYTREFCNWVIAQKGKVTWDIFSYNYSKEVVLFLKALNCPDIRLNKGVNYEELPAILRQYHIGVILYTGHIANYIYNAPNKLFEYLACGSDVWFPEVMVTALDYVRSESPKVVALKFDQLDQYNPLDLMKKSKPQLSIAHYFCEDALSPLINELFD